MSERAYIGIKPCGCATAVLVDDPKTTAKEVAAFARDMAKTGRRIENVPMDQARKRLQRCRCKP